MPDPLAGAWGGGGRPNDAGITFTTDGDVTYAYNNGFVIEGTVVVEGSRMTLYLPGGTQQSQWSIEELDTGYGYSFLTLYIDGYSYVRDVSN